MGSLTRDLAEFVRRSPDPLACGYRDRFEQAVTEHFEVPHAIAVSTGTAALHCAIAALEIGRGDEVLLPAISVVMSAVPVLYVGARPVFVDCDPSGTDFDYIDLAAKVSNRTKAIVAVHMWGRSCDMDRLCDFAANHGLAVVEDACQAHGTTWSGRRVGTWGQLGCFSMKDGKLMSTGEGGFVLTSDCELANFCRAFRNHWSAPDSPGGYLSRPGYNYRLSEIQCLLGIHQAQSLPELVDLRKEQTAFVVEQLSGVSELEPYRGRPREEWNHFSPILMISQRLAGKELPRALAAAGVANSVGTFGLMPADQRSIFRSDQSTCHTAAKVVPQLLALSLLPSHGLEELESMARVIRQIVADMVARVT